MVCPLEFGYDSNFLGEPTGEPRMDEEGRSSLARSLST